MAEVELKTVCKNCVFAEFDDQQQTGCSAGFLQKYEASGAEIVEEYYGDKIYKVINNKICLGCRLENSNWTKQYEGKDLLASMKKEVRFRCDAVVVITDDTKMEDIEKTTVSVIASSIKPDKVVYVYRNMKFNYAKLLKYVNSIYVGTGIKWQIKELDDENASLETMIAESVRDTVSEFSTTLVAGMVLAEGFIEKLRVMLREEMKEFILILPNDAGEGMVVLKYALANCGWNAPIEVVEDDVKKEITNFIEKLIIITKVQNKQRYIWTNEFQPLQ
jgi:hypothetical protein